MIVLSAAQLSGFDQLDGLGSNLWHQFAPGIRREATGRLRGAKGFVRSAFGGKRQQATLNFVLACFHRGEHARPRAKCNQVRPPRASAARRAAAGLPHRPARRGPASQPVAPSRANHYCEARTFPFSGR